MNVRKKEVSLRGIQKAAEDSFKGGFYCCEALVDTIIKKFDIDAPKEVVACASGMAVGIGKSGCTCGALNGGVLALGMLLGRTEPTGPADPTSVKCLECTKELHDWFKATNGKNTNCCRILTKEFDKGQGEHKKQCIYFTGLCAYKTAEIIVREFALTNTDTEEGPVIKVAPDYE